MATSNACGGLDAEVLAELRAIATRYRDAQGLFLRMLNFAGRFAEDLTRNLPESWQRRLSDATEAALRAAYTGARVSQGDARGTSRIGRALGRMRGERVHALAAMASGALGGAGGLATTLVDLPVTTALIFRSIQQIAADYGEDIADPEVRAQCLTVFALGGPLPDDDADDASLWALRVGLTGKTLAELVKAVAPRLGLVVSEKLIAQATPVLGAIAGAAINPLFTGYYQAMAHVHFRLRRLERTQDPEQLRACFEAIVRAMEGKPG